MTHILLDISPQYDLKPLGYQVYNDDMIFQVTSDYSILRLIETPVDRFLRLIGETKVTLLSGRGRNGLYSRPEPGP